jgi:hypothetical protein
MRHHLATTMFGKQPLIVLSGHACPSPGP